MFISGKTLFAFIGPKDPFVMSPVEGEQIPGPILSLAASRDFNHYFLFHTPHLRENAELLRSELRQRGRAHVAVEELPISDPKQYSPLMGQLARRVRAILSSSGDADHCVCVSSGTAEMRAAWFLLHATGVLRATMLQVGTPAQPLFGAASVSEVNLQGGW
jgi:sigma54-dependent transcription regulator